MARSARLHLVLDLLDNFCPGVHAWSRIIFDIAHVVAVIPSLWPSGTACERVCSWGVLAQWQRLLAKPGQCRTVDEAILAGYLTATSGLSRHLGFWRHFGRYPLPRIEQLGFVRRMTVRLQVMRERPVPSGDPARGGGQW